MWDAQECMGSCLRALAKLKVTELNPQDVVAILQMLPEAVQKLGDHGTWVQRCVEVVCEGASAGKDVQPLLLHLLGDVHAMLTSPDQFKRFRQLSFTAIKAWADSDNLVIDSEDSVAVALGWWVAGAEGRKCSQDQLKELSGLLRVRHMSAGGSCWENITACHAVTPFCRQLLRCSIPYRSSSKSCVHVVVCPSGC
jgi:hypothetical protein